MNKLIEICDVKRGEVAKRKRETSLDELHQRAAQQTPPRGFHNAIMDKAKQSYALIAEIKKASPSKGLIRSDFNPPEHARAYEAGGATCLSVLTDEPYFQGHDEFLVAARAATTLPCLRKDFMIDTWQVAESRALGADAILIIVAALDDSQMIEIEAAAIEYGMDALIEVHDAVELKRAQQLKSRLIGVNNRDLRQFTTDLAVTEELATLMPEGATLVSESGIGTKEDCQRLTGVGAKAFLVGETLMRQDDVQRATQEIMGNL